jgi:hypothetical protein
MPAALRCGVCGDVDVAGCVCVRLQVPALELFMALALYSKGHVKDRMAFCFEVFDDDGNAMLDMVRACGFASARAARVVGGASADAAVACVGRRMRCWCSFGPAATRCTRSATCR